MVRIFHRIWDTAAASCACGCESGREWRGTVGSGFKINLDPDPKGNMAAVEGAGSVFEAARFEQVTEIGANCVLVGMEHSGERLSHHEEILSGVHRPGRLRQRGIAGLCEFVVAASEKMNEMWHRII